jgi:hypothetical protein
MRTVLRCSAVLIALATLGGCGPTGGADSEPPPGVRKNEKPNTGVRDSKKGKPSLVGQDKQAP